MVQQRELNKREGIEAYYKGSTSDLEQGFVI